MDEPSIDLAKVPTPDLLAELQRRYAGKSMLVLTCCTACGHTQSKPVHPDGTPINKACRRCGAVCEPVTAEQLAANTGLAKYQKIVLG